MSTRAPILSTTRRCGGENTIVSAKNMFTGTYVNRFYNSYTIRLAFFFLSTHVKIDYCRPVLEFQYFFYHTLLPPTPFYPRFGFSGARVYSCYLVTGPSWIVPCKERTRRFVSGSPSCRLRREPGTIINLSIRTCREKDILSILLYFN